MMWREVVVASVSERIAAVGVLLVIPIFAAAAYWIRQHGLLSMRVLVLGAFLGAFALVLFEGLSDDKTGLGDTIIVGVSFGVGGAALMATILAVAKWLGADMPW